MKPGLSFLAFFKDLLLPLAVIPYYSLLLFIHCITRFFHRTPVGGQAIRASGLKDNPRSVNDKPAGEIKVKKILLCIATYGLYKEYIISIL
jgi:hypothetical protein